MDKNKYGPIGIFDSGYGGLTVFKEIVKLLPEYDFIYLGDNARIPYGTRAFETVYQYTWQCTRALLEMGCPLVVLACNTASAKALRTIQTNNIPLYPEPKKVLGVIRPTTEQIGDFTQTKHVGILATPGTVKSESYRLEIKRFFPEVSVYQEACPMWVSIVENNEMDTAGAAYFVKKHVDQLLKQSPQIDTIVLACTHYPLLYELIRKFTPSTVKIIQQGELVAASLKKYVERHQEIDLTLAKNGGRKFFTTESPSIFDEKGGIFFGNKVQSTQIFV